MELRPLDRFAGLPQNPKILFLSQESSADVVEEALSFGALGYVVKAHATTDLLAAVDAVSSEKQFVSTLSNYDAPLLPNLAPSTECDTFDLSTD
jgi:DNA-binding NarL/FixJ family response regulator